MKKLLVTGGTVFVSRYIAAYYIQQGYEVYVLNRNTKPQPKGTKLIQADRHHISNALQNIHFDVVIDTGYTAADVALLLEALGSYGDYIFISSSAVYPEYAPQPFSEKTAVGENRFWGRYGTDKIEAEQFLLNQNPDAYILRPPYLYGQLNNVYREAFVFDCALQGRKFYLPKDGKMNLQFFHINDLCRFTDILLSKHPSQHIFNVGNPDMVCVREWVRLCYEIVGTPLEFVSVYEPIEQRNYFSFYDYEYQLDVSQQCQLMSQTKPFAQGLKESFKWYKDHTNMVVKKPFFDYINTHLV